MRRFLSILAHRTRLWLARRWCDPQLAVMAERYGSVLVTSERFGKVLVPMYAAMPYDATASLAQRLDRMTEERDYWKRRAEYLMASDTRKQDA